MKIKRAPGRRIVAVVGAGHVPGILSCIEEEIALAPLEVIPPTSGLAHFLKWAIPALILIMLGLGFFRGGAEHSLGSLYIWFLINGTLSALGAALALGHPLTILSAFLAAPLTSLNPLIAAGWVSGLVQAFVKRPTVKDLEMLPEAITSAKGFWMNPVSRILLVVALSNLGSVAGTFVAGSWIAARLLGS
jgi:pheromone shutdown-related protein TraB